MHKMTGTIVILFIIVSMSTYGWSAPADDPSEMLARAEALYYEADFAKSIDLLLRADELLLKERGRLEEKTEVKLQLALGFIGLNDKPRAKAFLGQLYALDSDHRIDPQLFSPKVVQLAEEAKAEQDALRCRVLSDQAQQNLETGNADDALKVIGSDRSKCSAFAPLFSKAAELSFRQGLDLYKRGEMLEATRKFRAALRAEPQHELASEYLELTESKIEVAGDRALLAWRKDFNASDFVLAARDYRELLSRGSTDTIADVQSEYRRALSSLVDSWNRACASDDFATMEATRLRVNELLPESSFAEDILAKMKTCSHTSCIQMTTQLALTRLKTRVDPQFSAYALSVLRDSPTMRVKVRISATGDVATSEIPGGNPIVSDTVRAAVDQWKFSPAIVGNESRCVDTVIPIVVKFAQ